MDDFWDLFGVKKDIIDAIQAFGLHDGHLLQWTIRYVAGKNYVDQPARRRLLLVADLVEICEDALFTMTPILLKDPNVHSLSDVAVAYYSSAKGMRDGHVIRPPLLYRVPTAVLRNVVANADNVMIDDLARKTLIRIMDLAVAEQFDARSGALSHFIAQPACKSELSQVPKSTALKVREDLETLYRLHPLVVDADDILPLMGLGYTSAHKIASLNQSDFMREAENRGIITERAERIYLEAGRIDRRNDAVWVDIVKARTDVPVLSMSGLNHATPSDDGQDTNLTALFNDLDTVATENSTSVLGPASYLVDLLQMLDRANLSIKTVDPWTVQSATSARDVFLHRRPDIATAHLSKVDTETPVAYQDLAIEIMEQYLSRSLGLGADQEADVYKAVSHYVAPMATFPYNHAIATSRQLLQARGYSRYELLRRFQSDWDLVRRAFPDNPAWETSVAAAAAENVHQRRLTAEILKLQPLDFQAITQEAFYSPAFVRLLGIYDAGVTSKTYEEVVGVRQGGEYWGYEAYASEHGGDPYGGATWKMVDSASEISLRLIKDQLLVRSGLSSSQLNMVLKTRYIGKRLVVTLAKDDRFSDRLQDMRLQESPLVGGKEVAGRLSKRTCLDLQAFIRLYRRLGWPIQTLDAAIGVLARRAQIYEDDDHYHHVLDVAFLERLAAAQQLSTRVDVPLVELLPLWGPMDAQFSTSLYPKLFLHPQLVQQYPLLVPLASGEFLPTATFGENMGAILHALHITHADLLTLMEITRQDARTSWNLETIAELYRHQKMSHFLDLPISQYPKWWEYCQTMANPFLDPQSTLTSLGVWLRLPEEIPSVEAVLGLVTPADDENDDAPTAKHRERTAKDLAFIAQIVQSVADVESQYAPFVADNISDIEEDQLFTNENLLAMCSRVLGPVASKAAVEVIEGRIISDNGILRIFSESFKLQESEATAEFLKPLESDPLDFQKRQEELKSRRKKAISWMIPELKRRGIDTAVQTTLSIRFPDANPEILDIFLSGTASADHSYREVLAQVWHDVRAELPMASKIFFFPPDTTEYTFINHAGEGKLSLDDQPVDFVVAGPVLVTQPQPLRQGQPSVLELSEGLSLKGLTYFTAHGDARFDETSAIPVPAAKVIFQHLFRLERGLDMTKTVNMGPIEVEYYQKLTVDFSAMNFDQMTTLLSFLWNRQQLGVPGASLVSYYQYLQRASGRAANPSDTVEEKASLVELVSETCRVTKLTTESVSLFFDLRWPGLSTSERVKDLLARDLSPLHQLADCCEMSTTLGIPISTLHEWAQAPRLPNTAEDFDSAKQLKASLLSNKAENALARARESLASTQRRVLQEALFRVPILQAKKITTPDSLSAELLIDTQMGPGIQTSRIAQAIDSVQRFVQRCLIGLEKRYGIATTGIDQQLWGWMNKYTLWQANRKVYLYPENWADPSLRDDKTQAFEELENKMLQASLNKDVVGQLLREYVYAVHEVADLDLQAYLWERKPPYCGNYHFFARTRAAPFSFYYRRLEARSDARGSTLAKWLPWEKMEVDIPTHATDGDHQPLLKPGSYLIPALFKNRLFLFLPQITPRTVPAAPPTGSMMELAKSSSMPKSPQKGWEIKMAWVEMRNGKWSPKYVTATGIDVMEPEPSPSGPLVSVESFNFSIEPTTSDKTLTIVVEKLVPDPESHLDLPRQIRSRLGCFEMQGMQLRLVGTSPSAAVSSAIAGKVAFSRMLRKESTRDSEELRASVENYEVGIDPEAGHHSMLAVPDPPDMAGGEYELSWLLSYDHSQFKGVSGLVVERSVPDQAAQFYVSYPPITKDGAVDTTQKTVDTTHSFTQDTSLVLTEEIADNQGYECIFDALESLPKDQQDMAFGYYNNKYSELATPSSVYNWEIGFHVVALLMERLLATQQFDLALEVSRMVFDPRRDDANLDVHAELGLEAGAPGPLSRLDNCWRFFPFKSSELRLAGSVRDIIQSLVPGSKPDDMVDWEAHPFSPHPVARNRPAVYMKRFVMKIIEILIASGDQYFRQNSSESVGLATQRYVEASELFGPAPVEIDPPTKPVTKSYDDIRGDVNSFATAAVDMELEFPYFINPELRGYGVPEPQAASHMNGTIGFVRSTYFGVPANPQMQALRDLIDNRLFNIRNGLDIDGNPRRLPLFDQPLDPDQVASGVASGTSPSSLSEGLDGGPMPNYRARYLLQKALDLCGELRGFEDSCLSIRERRDSEAMANLRARQEVGVSALMTEIKQLQIQEATMAIATLQEARESHVSTLKYYLALMGESKDIKIPSAVNKWEDFEYGIVEPGKGELRMSPEEALESRSSDAAGYIDVVASGMECAGGLLKALPETTIETQPMGVGAATKFGASNLGEAMIASAGLVRLGEKAASEIASRAARKGQLTRQLQERKLSANMAAREIQSVDTQIATQKKQIEIAQAELRAHQQQVADTAEMEEWMRTKYTSEALYSWLEAQTRKLAYQTYLSALDMAKTAERAMMFEYGPKARSLLSNSYWDGSRDGMLAASQLTAALHRIEKFYMQNKPHDYELTKTISLRQVSPLALVDLRAKGVAEFELPEVLFDHDFPGHYCRRIQSVSLTIPRSAATVGPPNSATAVNCSLQLLEHRYRLQAGRATGTEYYRPDPSGNDARFHTDRIPISSVALSTCKDDSGTFQLDFVNSDRYVPFEGAGVVSKWKLELPGPFRQFDYATIGDVLVTVQYTALEGGAAWKKLASDAVREFRSVLQDEDGSGGAFLMVDIKADFPDEWKSLEAQLRDTKTGEEKKPMAMDLTRMLDMLPFWSVGQHVTFEKVWMTVQPAKGGWEKTGVVEALGAEMEEDVAKSGEGFKVLGPGDAKDVKDVKIAPVRLKGVMPKGWWVVVQYTQGK